MSHFDNNGALSPLLLFILRSLSSLPLFPPSHDSTSPGSVGRAITMEEGFSVMYITSSAGDSVRDCIAKAEETFRKQHPAFTDYLFTGMEYRPGGMGARNRLSSLWDSSFRNDRAPSSRRREWDEHGSPPHLPLSRRLYCSLFSSLSACSSD